MLRARTFFAGHDSHSCWLFVCGSLPGVAMGYSARAGVTPTDMFQNIHSVRSRV